MKRVEVYACTARKLAALVPLQLSQKAELGKQSGRVRVQSRSLVPVQDTAITAVYPCPCIRDQMCAIVRSRIYDMRRVSLYTLAR